MAKDSVPVALAAFFVSSGFEDAIRKAVSVGGDSDTVASMAGAVAEAFYGGVPGHIRDEVMARLPDEVKNVLFTFYRRVPL
jgi:ADP-ribosylglycohydrolase